MRCAACHSDNAPGARFCEECGAEFVAACTSCGQALRPGAKFCGGCGARVDGASRPTPEPAALPEPTDGERRQLTVLFCDLVGSTELSARLDPEELREVVRRYQQAAGSVVSRFGGHVAQYLGDGLLAYFGYPTAHEDDAERAVRAGLGMVDAVNALDQVVRVGIHTGPVVVSELGGGGRTETLALGETPNVAARVQGLAEANHVLVTAATHRLVAGLFLVEEGGAQAVKGVSQPVTVYRAIRPSGVRGRLALTGRSGLTPFIGRAQERRLLLDRWERAQEGNGQVVLVAGEAGIGKSRLLQQFREDIAATPHTWLESGCSPFHQHTPFHPLIELLQQFLAAGGESSREGRVAMLEAALGAVKLPLAEAVPLVALLLGLPVPATYLPLLASPEEQRRKLFATLTAWVLAAARLQPLVIVVEDLHWMDHSSAELQGLLAEQGAIVPLLLLYSARPEFRTPWPLHAHHTQVNLNRLHKKLVREMALQVAAKTSLSPELLDAVVARTDGVPLFVEELTKSVVESGLRGVGHDIPATLQDSLMARLDRLGAAKEVAQIASVLGREFDFRLLRAVSGQADAALEGALRRLADAELLFVRGLPPEATYTFKHALVQDTAYGALLKSRRRELHARVARAFPETFPAIAEAQPELLAHHLTEAGDVEPAVAAWRTAGERALRRGAPADALGHLGRGLEVLGALPDGPGRDREEFALQLARGHALLTLKGWAAPEAAAAYTRATELGERIADPVRLVLLLIGRWTGICTAAGPLAAQVLADQALAAAERSGFDPSRVWAHFAQAATHFYTGRFAEASQSADRALALYDEATALVATIDPAVATLAYAALAAWHLGHPDRAKAFADAGLERARGAGPADRAWAEAMASWVALLRRDVAAVVIHADGALAACTEQPNPVHESKVRVYRGWALAERGQVDEGSGEVRSHLAGFTQTGQRVSLEVMMQCLAEIVASAGQFDEALSILADAERACAGDEHARADSLRIRAEVLARKGATDGEVEATFRDALVWARRQGARSYELRTATRYATWLRDHGRAAEGRELLAPIYGWFTEGFDTRDLVEAKVLLEELG